MNKKISDDVVDRWRALHQQEKADRSWIASHAQLDQKRLIVCGEIQTLLEQFLSQKIPITEFRSTFDKKTRKEWDVFGLKAMSGAMFLNQLVKYVPNDLLIAEMKKALPVPQNVSSAQEKISNFFKFLKSIMISRKAETNWAPARIPFFVSAFWHVQDVEQWPIFFISARRTFADQGIWAATDDLAADYLQFRETYLALSMALGIKSWEFEHLCAWYDKNENKPAISDANKTSAPEPHIAQKTADEDESSAKDEDAISHTRVQFLLAQIGKKLGCKIWIASNDQGKSIDGKKLADLCIPTFPILGLGKHSQDIIKLIDVLWLKGNNQVVAAFEVEYSTSIYSGLLRMSDLNVNSNLSFPLYIVASEDRLPKVRQQLLRPTFQQLELHKACWFFSFEQLYAEVPHILAWANDPSCMKKFSEQVETVDDS